MKKLIIASAIAAATLTSTAEAAVTDFVDTSRPASIINLGVHVGDGVFSVRQNYASQIGSVTSFTLTPGNTFAVGASAILNVREFFGIGTGLDFSINNYDYNLTMLNGSEGLGTLNTLYADNRFYAIDIPLYVRFTFNIAGDRVRWTNELGAYLSFGAGGHTDISTYRSSTNPLGQSQVTDAKFSNDYFSDNSGIINRIVKTDAGLHVATGLTFNRHFSLKAVLHVGARNLARNFGVFDTRLYNLGMVFKAGYIF